jgi:hypothetical protein
MRRTRWATALVSWLGLPLLPFLPFLALLTPAACGDIDAGSTPFPGTVLYVDPGGAYQFNLVEPPWIPVAVEGVTLFIVPPSNLSNVADLSDAIYTLHVDTVGGTPEGSRNSEESGVFATATAPIASLQISETNGRTLSGATVYELSWEPSVGLFERDVFLAGPSSPTFRLQFGAQIPVASDDMVAQMILSFEPL